MAHFPKHLPYLFPGMHGTAACGLRPRGLFYEDYRDDDHQQQHEGESAPKRARTCTALSDDTTPATFHLNWAFGAENCTSNPKEEPGVVTLMGLYRENNRLQHRAEEEGKGGGGGQLSEHVSVPALAIYDAYLVLKNKHGFTFPLISSVLKEAKRTSKETVTAWQVISDHWTDGPFEFFNADGAKRGEVEASFDSPAWLFIRCQADICCSALPSSRNSSLAETLQESLKDAAVLAPVKHQKFEVVSIPGRLSDCYELQVETGVGDNSGTTGLGSLFRLYQKNRDGKQRKLVGKALCSYCNAEMATAGPTLELIEIASEFQGHGLGSALMDAVEDFYSQMFRSLNFAGVQVLFSVGHVNAGFAFRWFIDRGFSSVGEDLQKILY
jgi:GNAT superfamily N-acetyltransferase